MNHHSLHWEETCIVPRKKEKTERTNKQTNKQTTKQINKKEEGEERKKQYSRRHQVEIINGAHKYEPPIKVKRKQFYSDQFHFRLLETTTACSIACSQYIEKRVEISDDDA